MAGHEQKLKTLYLMKILLQKTDEQHILSATDLCRELKEYGIDAERKSIYSDVEVLQEAGLDVILQKGANQGYYIGKREFEIAELKLLVDAVQSSKFITVKKSNQLIRKLASMASQYDEKLLERQIFLTNRPKTENETIFYNVDKIHLAILNNCKIIFQYNEWTVQKKQRPRKDGRLYVVSPWALTWDDENYYLIAYEDANQGIRHYRVDKIKTIDLSQEQRQGKEAFSDFDLAAFAKKTFGMYGGREEKITFLCHNQLAGVIIDRFGQDVMLVPADETHFRVTVPVIVSSQFFGWAAAIGKNMKITAPAWVREEYKNYLTDLLAEY